MFGMEFNVLLNKRSNKVITVVVTFLHPHVDVRVLWQRVCQQLPIEQEVVCCALRNQELWNVVSKRFELQRRVPFCPLGFILSDVACKCFLTPITFYRVAYWREGRN